MYICTTSLSIVRAYVSSLRLNVKVNVYGTKMDWYGSGMWLLASPTPVLHRGCCWTHHRPITGPQYGIGMGLAPSPTRSLGRYTDPRTLSGMGASPIPVPFFRRYMDGILGSGMPVAPSPTNTDPFLNPRHNTSTLYCGRYCQPAI
jgi:hypothetical protein